MESSLSQLCHICFELVCYIRPDSTTEKSWIEAKQRCIDFTATLPIVDTPKQQRNFEAAVRQLTTEEERKTVGIWIGAKAFSSQPTNWTWLNGSEYSGTGIYKTNKYQPKFRFISNFYKKRPVLTCSLKSAGHF